MNNRHEPESILTFSNLSLYKNNLKGLIENAVYFEARHNIRQAETTATSQPFIRQKLRNIARSAAFQGDNAALSAFRAAEVRSNA